MKRVRVDHTVLMMPELFSGGSVPSLSRLSNFPLLLGGGTGVTAVDVAFSEEVYLEGESAVGPHEK